VVVVQEEVVVIEVVLVVLAAHALIVFHTHRHIHARYCTNVCRRGVTREPRKRRGKKVSVRMMP